MCWFRPRFPRLSRSRCVDRSRAAVADRFRIYRLGGTIIRQGTGFSELPLAGGSNHGSPAGVVLCQTSPLFVAQACPSDPRHRVVIYMSFQFHRDRWRCNFLEKDLQTRLPRTLNLATAEEVIALADRGGGLSNLAGRHALGSGYCNRTGRRLSALTADQHTQLQKYCKPASAGSHSRYL